MSIAPPATIAILGAGPIGLEAALYGRLLGYRVELYERGRAADNVRRWGHVRMFSKFGMSRSLPGLAACQRQYRSWRPPDDEALLTGSHYVENYLQPLAATDLIAEGLHEQCEVIAIGRTGALKGELVGDPARARQPFRLLLRAAGGTVRAVEADAVLDTTGTYGNANWLGAGGIPALGEAAARSQIEYGLPDVLGAERERYAARHTLVVGAGYSAATTVVALAALAEEVPATRVTWFTRRIRPDRTDAPSGFPIALIPDDPLEERDRLAQRANWLAADGHGPMRHVPGSAIEEIAWDRSAQSFSIYARSTTGLPAGEIGGDNTAGQASRDARLGRLDEPLNVDRMVANIGYRPDSRLWAELQVHECYATGGPMKLAAALLANAGADCLAQAGHGPESLRSPEPNFFVLGAKSYGRNSRFLIRTGLEQIRDAFALLTGRTDLDLYRPSLPADGTGV